MEKWLKVYYSVLVYPVLYFPYKFINYILIVKLFGCPCGKPDFNANNITNIFWILVGITTILIFVLNFLKNIQLKSKKNIILFIVSIVMLILYSILLTHVFANSMYWDWDLK